MFLLRDIHIINMLELRQDKNLHVHAEGIYQRWHGCLLFIIMMFGSLGTRCLKCCSNIQSLERHTTHLK